MRHYETVFQLHHKLRDAMVRHNRVLLGSEDTAELDKVLVSGATPAQVKEAHHKALHSGPIEAHQR